MQLKETHLEAQDVTNAFLSWWQ